MPRTSPLSGCLPPPLAASTGRPLTTISRLAIAGEPKQVAAAAKVGRPSARGEINKQSLEQTQASGLAREGKSGDSADEQQQQQQQQVSSSISFCSSLALGPCASPGPEKPRQKSEMDGGRADSVRSFPRSSNASSRARRPACAFASSLARPPPGGLPPAAAPPAAVQSRAVSR